MIFGNEGLINKFPENVKDCRIGTEILFMFEISTEIMKQ